MTTAMFAPPSPPSPPASRQSTSGAHGSTSRHIAVSIVGNVFSPLAALATAPIMAQSLGVAGRGDVAGATAPLFLAVSLATFGVPSAVTYFVSKNPALRRALAGRAAVLLLGGGIVVLGVVLALSGVLSGGDRGLRRLVVIASLAIVPSLLGSLLQAVAAGERRWGLVAGERFVTAATRLAAFIVLAAGGGLDVTSSVVILAVSPVVGALVYVPMLIRPRALPAAPDQRPGSRARDLLHYGLRVWLGSVAGVLLLRLDQALIGPLSGAEVLGLYAVAATIADLPLVVNSAVRDVLFSADSAEQRDDRLARASRLSTLVVGVVVACLAAVLPWGLPLLFGGDFGPAVPVCVILLAGLVVSNPGSVAGVGLSSRGRPGLRSAALGAACLVNVVLVVLLAPPFGALGAGIATAAGSIVAGWLNVALLCRISAYRRRDFVGVRRADLAVLAGVVRGVVRRG